MSLEVTVYHASTPTYPGGYSVDLGGYVRKGLLSGVVHNAEQVSVGEGEIVFDDPDFSLGHSGDGIKGWQQCALTESLAPTGRHRIWTGYTNTRRRTRGDSERPSLITAKQSICTCSVEDLNAFLSFRNLRTTTHGSVTANRPAETDVERIQWLLSVYFLSTTVGDGLVSLVGPVDMDAADYTDQKPADVINDCLQQSGKNAFLIYDEAGDYGMAGDFVLFYDFNDSLTYLTTAQVSNVLADKDDETDDAAITLPPLKDGTSDESPDRVYAGNMVPFAGGVGYAENPDTADAFVWRDSTQPAGPKIKTLALADARAERYAADLSTEELRLSWSEDLPAKHVNRWLAGQAGRAKFSHLRDFQDFRYVRVLKRTVRQTDTSGQRYIVEYEATPICIFASTDNDLLESTLDYNGASHVERYHLPPDGDTPTLATGTSHNVLYGTLNSGIGFKNALYASFGVSAFVENRPFTLTCHWDFEQVGGQVAAAQFGAVDEANLSYMSLWGSDDNVTYEEVITGAEIVAGETAFFPGATTNQMENVGGGGFTSCGPWSEVAIPAGHRRHRYWSLRGTAVVGGSGLGYVNLCNFLFVRLIEGECS